MGAKLDWRIVRGDAGWQQGFAGEFMVADVTEHLGLGGARWTLSWTTSHPADRCHSRGFSVMSDEAENVEAAKGAAEAAWTEWLTRAGLLLSPATSEPGR